VHAATGAAVWVLPSPRRYALLRARMRDPYGWRLADVFADDAPPPPVKRQLRAAIRALAPYAATPPLALVRALRAEGCGAMLCQEYEYARFDLCVTLGRALGMPVFATFQGGRPVPHGAEPALRPHTVRAAAGLIVATAAEAARVQERYGVPAERIARVFNPVDAERWTGGARAATRRRLAIPDDAQVVVSHGRISIHAKGLDVLAHAWKALCAARPGRDLRLLLVGTGEDAAAFRGLIGALELPGVVWIDEFVLDRGAVRDYLAAGDVYVLASRQEGFPVAPVEAMACGLPVVATDAPGVPDILEAGERSGGIVVPRGDAGVLSDALGRLLDDPAHARLLGDRARRRVEERFSLGAVGHALAAFMHDRGLRAAPVTAGAAAGHAG
jgi:starch synthase